MLNPIRVAVYREDPDVVEEAKASATMNVSSLESRFVIAAARHMQ